MFKITKDFCKQFELLPLKQKFLLKFKVERFFQLLDDEVLNVSIRSSNKTLKVSNSNSSIRGKKGEIATYVESDRTGLSVIEIVINNNIVDRFPLSFRASKDVFNDEQIEKLTTELLYIAQELSDPNRHSEYDKDYSLQAMDRAIGLLVEDSQQFYAVGRDSHKPRNSINLTESDYNSRIDQINSNGFVESQEVFRQFLVNILEVKQFINSNSTEETQKKNLHKIKYNVVSISDSGKKALIELFEKFFEEKEVGNHVFYCALDIKNPFLIIINTFSDSCDPIYEIWNQYGKYFQTDKLANLSISLGRICSDFYAADCLKRLKEGDRTVNLSPIEMKIAKIQQT